MQQRFRTRHPHQRFTRREQRGQGQPGSRGHAAKDQERSQRRGGRQRRLRGGQHALGVPGNAPQSQGASEIVLEGDGKGDEAVVRMHAVYDKRRKLMVELMRGVGFGIPVKGATPGVDGGPGGSGSIRRGEDRKIQARSLSTCSRKLLIPCLMNRVLYSSMRASILPFSPRTTYLRRGSTSRRSPTSSRDRLDQGTCGAGPPRLRAQIRKIAQKRIRFSSEAPTPAPREVVLPPAPPAEPTPPRPSREGTIIGDSPRPKSVVRSAVGVV
jgi:hypothetical protein